MKFTYQDKWYYFGLRKCKRVYAYVRHCRGACIYPSPSLVCYKLTRKLNEFEMIDKLYHWSIKLCTVWVTGVEIDARGWQVNVEGVVYLMNAKCGVPTSRCCYSIRWRRQEGSTARLVIVFLCLSSRNLNHISILFFFTMSNYNILK